MTELTQAGWLAEGERWWNEVQCAFALMPSITGIVECLEHAYESRDDAKLREGARKFALAYDADRVMDIYWKPVLEELAKPITVPPLNGKPESRQVRRARERAKQ